MATLAEIRAQSLVQITQTTANSDFTTAELNGFINQAIVFFATQVKWPRALTTVTPVAGTSLYSLPSDSMIVVEAFYGDRNTQNDVRRLKIFTVEMLSELYPQWLDSTTATRGRPDRFVTFSRNQFVLSPTPAAEYVASGTRVHLFYVNYPATLSNDSSSPDLPTAYHDHVATYVAHLCYGGRLKNPDMAKSKLTEVQAKLKLLEQPATKETEEQFFAWGHYDPLDTDIYEIDPR